MQLLHEIASVRQIPGEPRRRWFTSLQMDLFIWYAEAQQASAFQLCYDKPTRERALNWDAQTGFSHLAVDDGEGRSSLDGKMTPVMSHNNQCDPHYIQQAFIQASADLPVDVVDFVTAHLNHFTALQAQNPPNS